MEYMYYPKIYETPELDYLLLLLLLIIIIEINFTK